MTAAEAAAMLAGNERQYAEAVGLIALVNPADLLIELITALDGVSLSNQERERRLMAVYTRAALTSEQREHIAAAVPTIKNAVLKNALTQLLPPELKRRAIGPRSTKSETAAAPSSLKERPNAPRIRDEPMGATGVVILSREPDQATLRRLGDAGFSPVRYESMGELGHALSASDADVCGFLIETSFLNALSAAEQAELVTRLAKYSTFAFIRIQEDGLRHEKALILEVIQRARYSSHPPSATEVSFQGQPGLRDAEVQDLRSASSELASAVAGLFIPGELSEEELALLAAALARHAGTKQFRPRAILKQVRTRFLEGGLTGAKVVLASLNDDSFPLVVKIAERAMITDEMERFSSFIAEGDRDLRPQMYMHGESALIIFDVISGGDDDKEPAPTLEKTLQNHWFSEMAETLNPAETGRIAVAFASAVRKLCTLNKRRCHDMVIRCKANPYILLIEKMEGNGFDWGLGDARVVARREAAEVLEDAGRLAISHGDTHGRNVLLRGSQGFLIDYQYSGPGHPCSDLTKLELSAFFTHFRPFTNEEDVVALQRDLSDWNNSIDDLLRRYAAVIASRTNELVLRMCVDARDAAREVLASYGFGIAHYRSVKLLQAWQALQGTSLAQGLVRATIIALS